MYQYSPYICCIINQQVKLKIMKVKFYAHGIITVYSNGYKEGLNTVTGESINTFRSLTVLKKFLNIGGKSQTK